MPPRLSWITLVVIGALAVVMGLAFLLLRPSVVLLPEDQRYTSLTPEQLRTLNPQLFRWIGMVFRSWGAFAIGLGISLIGIASFAYRRGEAWARPLLFLVGTSMFGPFLAVNLLLGSDFKFLIGSVSVVYMGALLYGWKPSRRT